MEIYGHRSQLKMKLTVILVSVTLWKSRCGSYLVIVLKEYPSYSILILYSWYEQGNSNELTFWMSEFSYPIYSPFFFLNMNLLMDEKIEKCSSGSQREWKENQTTKQSKSLKIFNVLKHWRRKCLRRSQQAKEPEQTTSACVVFKPTSETD